MASLASAARDIPKASLSRDNLTVVAARSVPGTVTRSQALPTPPNSISPGLPPLGLKAQIQKARLEPIDSDLDLQERGDGDSGSPGLESAGAITSAMLAKYHLPDILLNHGPLAIRHITGYLTTSVPGFSGIPPAKARRLVVGALEGRGAGEGGGGGVDGEVHFEKVGWGRWDARQRGQPPRERRPSPLSDDGSSSAYASGIPIANAAARGSAAVDRTRLVKASAASSGGGSMVFSHDGREHYMPENEADKMSLDESASASCSDAPDDDDDMMDDDDPDMATDDEDWAAIGAAALRADSYPSKAAAAAASSANNPFTSRVYNGGGMRSLSGPGMARSLQPPVNMDFSAFGRASDAQEREAVEALLRLGSV